MARASRLGVILLGLELFLAFAKFASIQRPAWAGLALLAIALVIRVSFAPRGARCISRRFWRAGGRFARKRN